LVCKNCGTRLLYDPNKMLVCSECNSLGHLYTKEETKKFLKKQLRKKIKYFLEFCSEYDKVELIYLLHRKRDDHFPLEIFFSRYFSLTYGIGILLKFDIIQGKEKPKRIEMGDFNILYDMCRSLYLDKHHLFFAKLDAVRVLKTIENNQLVLKYTENWIPIYKRQILCGSFPQDFDIQIELNRDLFAETHYRKIFLEELHKKEPNFENISLYLDFLQNYLFHYPWGEYLKVGRDERNINFFLRISKILQKKGILFPKDKIMIKGKEQNYIEKKWISKPNNSSVFPTIIELNNKWFVPSTLFSILYEIYNIFSSKNRSLYARYIKALGNILEDRVFHDLHIYNLSFNSPNIPNKELKRFLNPENKSEELFDVGAIDHKFHKFYIVECKNKTRIILRNYDPIKLNDYIKQEFIEFRDINLPNIDNLKSKWKLESYKTIPMFYNFVPLYGEFENLQKFQLMDGIHIIQNFAEIGSIVQKNFRKNRASFYEIYNIPKKFLNVITGNSKLNNINYKLSQDVGYLFDDKPEKYLIHTGKIYSDYKNQAIPDLDVKLDNQYYILSIDIPPELIEKVENLNLRKEDRVSVLFYRIGPYSQIFILGNIWKL